MNRTNMLSAFLIATTAIGCASTTESQKINSVSTRDSLSIVQVAGKGKADFFFCDSIDTTCPERTRKVVAVTPVKPKVVSVEPQPVVDIPPAVFKVHFRWGWSNLDAAGRQELSLVLAAVEKDSILEVLIQGSTDPTGSIKFNEKLAQRRSDVVKSALVEAGIRPEIITSKSHHPCCIGSVRASKAVMQEKRRADLEITIRTVRQK